MGAALPSLGAISMADYNTALDNPAGTQLSMNSSSFRMITGKTQDQSTISMTDGYGKTARYVASASTTPNTTIYNVDVKALLGTNYSPGKTDFTYTISYGTVIASTSTGTPALSVTGFTTGDRITIINYGKIIGKGGDGGRGASGYLSLSNWSGGVGGTGGTGLYTNFAISVDNSGQIAGGGGGGAGGGSFTNGSAPASGGGSGGGGGAGANVGQGGPGGPNEWGNWPGNPGQPGTEQSGGAGGASIISGGGMGTGGGAGGNLGNPGGAANKTWWPYGAYAGSPGGGGSAVVGETLISWLNVGLISGARN